MIGLSAASADVPLPKPRPVEAPPRQAGVQENKDAAEVAPASDAKPEPAKPEPAKPEPAKPEPANPEIVRPAEPPASPCRLALTENIAIAPSIPPVHGPGACGGDDLVRLEAIVVSPEQHVVVKPPAILRCTMATAIANWVREDAAPLALSLGSPLRELDNFDSYECRGRNRVRGAQLSEHGKANALDVRSLNLADGTKLSLTDRHLPRDIREKVLVSVCTRFMTVLGPGSDWYHEDHIHLDLAERRNNFKLCQWGVYDPLPEVAAMMPQARPPEAPQRPEAEKKPEQTEQGGAEPEEK